MGSSKNSSRTRPSGLFLNDAELWKDGRTCKAKRRWTTSIEMWLLGRARRAVEANSAQVAQRVAGVVARPAPPPDAADVMTGGATGSAYPYMASTINDEALSLQREYPQATLDGGLAAANAKAKSRRRVIGTVGKT